VEWANNAVRTTGNSIGAHETHFDSEEQFRAAVNEAEQFRSLMQTTPSE
jgi:hypothetical protein